MREYALIVEIIAREYTTEIIWDRPQSVIVTLVTDNLFRLVYIIVFFFVHPVHVRRPWIYDATIIRTC